jgi:hypothetical protein
MTQNFKPGDRVRFLNTTGGGVVKKIINSFMVSVAIEDGFEIPTLTSELVLIEAGNTNDRLFINKDEVASTPELPATGYPEPERVSAIRVNGIHNPFSSGIYLAYVPQDQQWVMTGKMDIFLINNTDQDILYSIFLKEDNDIFSGIDYGSLAPNSRMILESIMREDINHWSGGVIQVLFCPDEADKVLMPVSEHFRIKGAVFFKENNYKECGLLENRKAILYTVCELNRILSTFEHRLREKEGTEPLPESVKKFRIDQLIDNYRIAHREAEVDLHISALREKYDNLSPREILTIQIGVFERMLESALSNNYTRIVFIHGVGNGTLKQALIDRVKDYGDIEFRNASFTKYGNGAIELILHQNL